MAGTNLQNDYVAGALGGCIGMMVGHPLDTVKVQMQTQRPDNPYRGMWDCIKTISKQKLNEGFFRGMSVPLASFAFINSAFFGAYGHCLKWFRQNTQNTGHPNVLQIASAGFIATFPTVFIACPIDVVKITLQSQIEHGCSQHPKYFHGPLEAATIIFKRNGIRGLYRGFWSQLARDSPANASYMAFYEMTSHGGAALLPTVPTQLINFICGGGAGVVSWLLVMPCDFIKSRIQADSQSQLYRGFWHCAQKTFSEEGILVFYRGTLAVILRAFPVNAVTLMVYTDVLKLLNSQQ